MFHSLTCAKRSSEPIPTNPDINEQHTERLKPNSIVDIYASYPREPTDHTVLSYLFAIGFDLVSDISLDDSLLASRLFFFRHITVLFIDVTPYRRIFIRSYAFPNICGFRF